VKWKKDRVKNLAKGKSEVRATRLGESGSERGNSKKMASRWSNHPSRADAGAEARSRNSRAESAGRRGWRMGWIEGRE
jgi:hypothetical protein